MDLTEKWTSNVAKEVIQIKLERGKHVKRSNITQDKGNEIRPKSDMHILRNQWTRNNTAQTNKSEDKKNTIDHLD